MANGLKTGITNLLTGQQAVTTAAAALNNAVGLSSLTVQALSTNTIPVYIGPPGVTTATGYQLVPGASITLSLPAANSAFAVATATGASVSYLGQF